MFAEKVQRSIQFPKALNFHIELKLLGKSCMDAHLRFLTHTLSYTYACATRWKLTYH